jgi:hypothetical protein
MTSASTMLSSDSTSVAGPAVSSLPVNTPLPSETNLYIQGDTPNTWMEAQDWQKDFLTPLHVSLEIKPSFFFKNRKYDYLAYPLKKNTSCLCPDLSKVHTSVNMSAIPYYGGYGWIFGHSVATDPYKTVTPPMGVLVNLKTGASRYYIFTTSSLTEVSLNHPHVGATKVCQKCLDGYKVQQRDNVKTPDFSLHYTCFHP